MQAVKPSKSLRNGKQATDSNGGTLRGEYKILSHIHRLDKKRPNFVEGVPVPIAFFDVGKAFAKLSCMRNEKTRGKVL